jgi:hypothetical protein
MACAHDPWVLTEVDIDRCARYMIDHYGAAAARRAQSRAADLRALGEPGAAESWEHVKTAIERLQARKP